MALFLSPEILQTVRQKEERVRESFTGTVHNSLARQTVADVWRTVDKREWRYDRKNGILSENRESESEKNLPFGTVLSDVEKGGSSKVVCG